MRMTGSCTVEIKHFRHVCEGGEFQYEGSPSTKTNHFVKSCYMTNATGIFPCLTQTEILSTFKIHFLCSGLTHLLGILKRILIKLYFDIL